MQLKKFGKVIILGSGQLSKSIQEGVNNSIVVTDDQINFLSPGQIALKLHLYLDSFTISSIINCAAYNLLKQDDEIYAKVLQTSLALAQYCRRRNIKLVYFSGYEVFDGLSADPYTEEDKTSPITQAGRNAVELEKMAIQSNSNAIIFRLPWMYSIYSEDNFVFQLIQRLKDNEEISVSSDQTGNLLNTFDLSSFMSEFLNLASEKSAADLGGIYHLSSHGFRSKFEIATMIINIEKRYMPGMFKIKTVNPLELNGISDSQIQKNCRLNSHKAQDTFGITLSDWKFSLHNAVQKILNRMLSKQQG